MKGSCLEAIPLKVGEQRSWHACVSVRYLSQGAQICYAF